MGYLTQTEVGNRFKIARIEKGLTQKELAKRCGMADSAIRKYESGKISPKLNTLRKIAKGLELPEGFFYGARPFEDLRVLDHFKRIILLSLQDRGMIQLNERHVSEVGDYEYWRYLGDFVEDVKQADESSLEITFKSSCETQNTNFVTKELDLTSFISSVDGKNLFDKTDKAIDETILECFKDITDIDLNGLFFTIFHNLNRLGKIKAIESIRRLEKNSRYKKVE